MAMTIIWEQGKIVNFSGNTEAKQKVIEEQRKTNQLQPTGQSKSYKHIFTQPRSSLTNDEGHYGLRKSLHAIKTHQTFALIFRLEQRPY